jgi:signal peptidase I
MTPLNRLFDFFGSRRMTIAEESMLPSLRPGDGVVFSRRTHREGGLRRGEIVLVRAPAGSGRLDVKRVVGLPGEHLSVRGSRVEINGKLLDEPYLADWVRTDGPPAPPVELQLHADEFAVLSDNRVHPGAVDSRRYGPVRRAQIIGRYVRRF